MATSIPKTKTTTAKAVVETKPVAEEKAAPAEDSSANNIEKIVQDHTPTFVSKGINYTIDTLESFRSNYFNSPYIFYPLVIILVFLVLRYLWRKFF
ncbi:MAG TPA: hypothetical protein VGO63_00570 [Candidatus Paceibacterota bacterium]|jgi:hypothetical protein|nr:hypothetical protein [Candidatus Paceibacterota bacterium]